MLGYLVAWLACCAVAVIPYFCFKDASPWNPEHPVAWSFVAIVLGSMFWLVFVIGLVYGCAVEDKVDSLFLQKKLTEDAPHAGGNG